MDYPTQSQEYTQEFWRKAFDLMRMAIESALNPLISRQDAMAIIGKRGVYRAIKLGKITPIQHGKFIFFDRIEFYSYCRMSNPNT